MTLEEKTGNSTVTESRNRSVDIGAFKPITVIAASAGTGKTYRLSEEYLYGLKLDEDSLAFSSIVATTFTNKAADELLERVRRVLLGAREWVAAQGVLSGYLGTVNSLCGHLLSEYAIDAGLSPDLTVIGEERLASVFAIAVDSVIHEFADEMHGPATRMQLGDWRTDVHKVIDYARNNNLSSDRLEEMANRSWEAMNALLPPKVEGNGKELDDSLAATIEKVLTLLPGPDDNTQATRKAIENLSDVDRRLKSGAHVVWQSWAAVSKLKGGKGSNQIIALLAESASAYLRHPRLHDDIKAIIFGVFRCAAAAMQEYADYKREHGLIDFVDQELLTLSLLKQPSVCESLANKIHLLLVDEFQDTSPIQLAIFLELAKLVDYSVWVGDEKQSIYGFRGSDPELMRQAIELLVRTTGGSKDVLARSYRSRPALVGFTNALFSQCSQLRLITSSNAIIESVDRNELPGQNSALHVWWLKGKRQENALSCLAGGIADVLADPEKWSIQDRFTKELRPITGSDIAILCRTNDSRIKAARALVAQGLTVATERDSLLDTPECVLACSALRVIIDESDTLAVAELINLLMAGEGQWLSELLAMGGRGKLDKWLDLATEEIDRDYIGALTAIFGGTELPAHDAQTDRSLEALTGETSQSSSIAGPGQTSLAASRLFAEVLECLRKLKATRAMLVDRTPLEVLELAINTGGILDTIESWGNVRQRLANLDSLRGIAKTYEEMCRSARVPATAAGLIVHIHKFVKGGGNQPANPDENGIHILTYHKAKGLEWPMVVLFDLDRLPTGDPFGITVESLSSVTDPHNPLEGRTIRYWPWPFGNQKSKVPLAESAGRTPQGRMASKRAIAENVRLLYVGMTRARDYLIFGCRNTMSGTRWLHCLTDEEYEQRILDLSYQEIAYTAELIQGVKESTAFFKPLEERESVSTVSSKKPIYGMTTASCEKSIETTPYLLNPSNASELDFAVEVCKSAEIITIGNRIPLRGQPEMNLVGDCVHAFLSVDITDSIKNHRLKVASHMVSSFVPDTIVENDLLLMSDRLQRFLIDTYPNVLDTRTEIPVSGMLGIRRVKGTIDLLLETDDGFIVIDHKTFPGRFEEWEKRALSYAPQMALYKHIVEQATSRPVIAQYIHMPVVGVLVKFDCTLKQL